MKNKIVIISSILTSAFTAAAIGAYHYFKNKEEKVESIPLEVNTPPEGYNWATQQAVINDLSLVAANSLVDLIQVADDHKYDRTDTLDIFLRMMQGYYDYLDIDRVDPNSMQKLN